MRIPARAALRCAAFAALLATGCEPDAGPGSLADRGRTVYVSQCTTCHAVNPAQAGPVGPPVQGASRALLEAKIVNGSYPPGYAPKRPTRVMQPMPHVAPDLDALVEHLK